MKRISVALAIATMVSACAVTSHSQRLTIADPQLRTAWEQHEIQLKRIHRWRLSGRFGAKTEEEAWNGSIIWNQDQDRYTIRLTGPLSQGSIELSGEEGFAQLRLSENDVFIDSDAERLLERHTGMQLPVQGLQYWIRGLPSPRTRKHKVVVSEQGHLVELEENHWKVDFRRYEDFQGTTLPTKIFLQHDHVEVRLVLDSWNVNAADRI